MAVDHRCRLRGVHLDDLPRARGHLLHLLAGSDGAPVRLGGSVRHRVPDNSGSRLRGWRRIARLDAAWEAPRPQEALEGKRESSVGCHSPQPRRRSPPRPRSNPLQTPGCSPDPRRLRPARSVRFGSSATTSAWQTAHLRAAGSFTRDSSATHRLSYSLRRRPSHGSCAPLRKDRPEPRVHRRVCGGVLHTPPGCHLSHSSGRNHTRELQQDMPSRSTVHSR